MNSCNPSLPDPVKLAYASLPEKVDYNFHIKPILADRCYACHGPDVNSRKGNLRLDIEEEAFAKLSRGQQKAPPRLLLATGGSFCCSDCPKEVLRR